MLKSMNGQVKGSKGGFYCCCLRKFSTMGEQRQSCSQTVAHMKIRV